MGNKKIEMNYGLEISNYKCFNDEFFGFKKIKGINLLIGKNNSGKSSLIELVQSVIGKKEAQIKPADESTIRITTPFPKLALKHPFKKTRAINMQEENVFEQDLLAHRDKSVSIDFRGKSQKIIVFNFEYPDHHKADLKTAASQIGNPFETYIFRKVASQRNIKPEGLSQAATLKSNGDGATNYIQVFKHFENRDRKIIDDLFLKELNSIINPEILFTDIECRKNVGKSTWEVFFENAQGKLIPISKMGSGIQTVLLVLINLLLVPIIEDKKIQDFIFAFEELENNLHPSLQKRLFSYILKFQEETNAIFFLTTHSNVVIDLFSRQESAQILHIINDTVNSTVSLVESAFQKFAIIEDLGNKASDILQSNGIIWVEGPSDRNYINKWIELIKPTYIEGVHYTILQYGGKLLSNLSAKTEYIDNELIPILRINRNAYVVIDKDAKSIDTKINSTKERVKSEIGEGKFWITDGKEIENYLTKETLEKWVAEKSGKKINLKLGKFENVGKEIESKAAIKYNANKTKFSKAITKHMKKTDLRVLNLEEKMNELLSNIEAWNS